VRCFHCLNAIDRSDFAAMELTMQYPLTFTEEDGDIAVDSVDMPELITGGSTEQEAMDMAEDALAVVLLTYIEIGRPIPKSRKAKAGERMVVVPAATAAKIAVIQAFQEADISKAELARRMGVAMTEAQRILDVNHATKLEKLDAAARALGRRITVNIAA
jgi:antitoxin HicB